jgi:hypothetical protein
VSPYVSAKSTDTRNVEIPSRNSRPKRTNRARIEITERADALKKNKKKG